MSWKIDHNVANYLALAGSATAVLMWIGQIRDIWTGPESVFALKTSNNVPSGFSYVASIFNCLLWNVYALNRLDTMMVPFVVNAIGLVLNASFVYCFYTYADDARRKQVTSHLFVFNMLTLLPITYSWILQSDDAVGYFAAFVNIVMMFGPLAAAGEVIKTRTTRGLSPMPMLMGLLSSLIWCAYGVYIKETPSIAVNVLGILSSIIQFTLYGWAKNEERRIVRAGLGAGKKVE